MTQGWEFDLELVRSIAGNVLRLYMISPSNWPFKKKSLHLNDNTGFCSITQASKLVFGSLLAKNTFFVQFWTKIFASSRMTNCGSGLPAEWPFRSQNAIGKTPVRIILWCPIIKMFIKACFLVQPLEQEGVYQKCCISLCSKVFINHFYQMKASPECLNILTYGSKYWVDRLRRTIGRKV